MVSSVKTDASVCNLAYIYSKLLKSCSLWSEEAREATRTRPLRVLTAQLNSRISFISRFASLSSVVKPDDLYSVPHLVREHHIGSEKVGYGYIFKAEVHFFNVSLLGMVCWHKLSL